VVEGNIGSGKTTFLEKFQALSTEEVKIYSEPVEQWRNVQGHNLLDLMYSDPTRYSLLFQTYVQLTMAKQHSTPCDKPVKIMERSLLSARYCFVENLYEEGKLSDAEYAVLSEWFNFLITSPAFDFSADLIVYLRTSPSVAHRRILSRSRHEESAVPLSYLERLHQLHDDWLLHRTKFQPLKAQVIVIDANAELEEGLNEDYARHGREILKEAEERRTRGKV